MLLPHEWFSALQQHDMLELMTNASEAKSFWEGQALDLPKRLHGLVECWNLDAPPIPMVLHGDGVPHTEEDSVVVVSMRSMLTKRSVSESQLLLTAVSKNASVSQTWKDIWEVLAASFKKLQDQGLAFIYAVTGDLEWYAQEFQFPRAMSDSPCPYCRCDM